MQHEPSEDSFFRGGPTPLIHDTLEALPLHGEEVYQEISMGLEKAIQENAAEVYKKVQQSKQSCHFTDAIPPA